MIMRLNMQQSVSKQFWINEGLMEGIDQVASYTVIVQILKPLTYRTQAANKSLGGSLPKMLVGAPPRLFPNANPKVQSSRCLRVPFSRSR
jgi:hypothetical protein